MINLGNGVYRPLEEINRALRLEKLLKIKIKVNRKDLKHRQKSCSYQGWCAESIIDEALQSLVDKSENS